METNGLRTKLWMKGFRRRTDIQSTPQGQPQLRSPRRLPKNSGATGLGFRVRVSVCPKLDQVFLAFCTLLFIVSIDLFVLTAVNVGPGLLSRKFKPTKCLIVDKAINASSYCYITTFANRGKRMRFPCLQIYVTTNFTVTMPSEDTPSVTQGRNRLVAPPLVAILRKKETMILYQNELHLAGEDYIHRPCSFLPNHCSGNVRDIAWQVYNYSQTIGNINTSIDCHYSDSSGLDISTKGVVMRERTVTEVDMMHTILWPLVGVILSILCCSAFWKQNAHRAHRLFIYNSWSPS